MSHKHCHQQTSNSLAGPSNLFITNTVLSIDGQYGIACECRTIHSEFFF